ncbi:hypothetical protein HAX54_032542 [Datura stramonium]|uniref:Uncharacterized protein n=1 Tax=Datura stramonium TaxID=4076 RepID=A0ABS8VEI8_DATST|nr:hypothetical protein [Datura stramonium]
MRKIKYTLLVCEHLFAAFHFLQESQSDDSRVSLSKWIGFWHKKPLKYESALPRREKKIASLKSTHNPFGIILETSQWSRDKKGVFHKLGTHYAFANVPSNPLMVTFSGEGVARYFDKKEARKRIHLGDNIAWTSTILNNSKPYDYIDNDEEQALESNYFMSIRFGYLFLRNGDSTIIKPYSPYRFSRQLVFYQRIPGALANDNRNASLAEGLRYWRICVLDKSMSRATFPPITPNVKKLFADDYKTWWSKTHGNFLDGYLQTLVEAAGPISTKIPEVAHQECSNAVPHTRNSFTPLVMSSEQCKGKGP